MRTIFLFMTEGGNLGENVRTKTRADSPIRPEEEREKRDEENCCLASVVGSSLELKN